METRINDDVAGRLEELARLLESQGGDRFRVRAYLRAAQTVRQLTRPVSEILAAEGVDGLQQLPHIGESIARAIRDMLTHGRFAMLERLRGESDAVTLLASVPGIGRKTADHLHHDLGIDTLQDLEAAAHDGRLVSLAGFGPKRLAGVRDTLAHRLGRLRPPPRQIDSAQPSVDEILDVDHEYRRAAAAGSLPRIAPRRFNPTHSAWLPILHTTRGHRSYTALYSNTERAHRLGKTGDWVVIYWDTGDGERQCTVITAERGARAGTRIVRGREDDRASAAPPAISRAAS